MKTVNTEVIRGRTTFCRTCCYSWRPYTVEWLIKAYFFSTWSTFSMIYLHTMHIYYTHIYVINVVLLNN